MIETTFEHWRYTFTEEMLIKYGSRYFSRKDAGVEYARDIHQRSEIISSLGLDFSEGQIHSGNEAFAEAAVADPIADLEIWDEWRSGTRSFPYAGRYSRLDITRQDVKTSSPSSVGVVGEIMAGFFAQAGVSPWVLVRVVRRWPDFIFADRKGTYSFVESKAFTGEPPSGNGLRSRVLDGLVIEGAIDAAQQLNSDAFGKVWNSFTRITSITPMRFDVTFLEFNVPDSRRRSQTLRTIPAAVVDGLAKRAVNQAAAQLSLTETDARLTDPKRRREVLVPELGKLADKEVDVVLSGIDIEAPVPTDRRPIAEAVKRILDVTGSRAWKPPKSENLSGRRLMEAKQQAIQGRLSAIRRSGELMIYLADLPEPDISRIRRDWNLDWSRASLPWGTIDRTELWRCGGAVICLGGSELGGREIRSAGLYRA